uniref:Uncharacterized protein n=1 Tax=Medicago truncatula TaxID=3880 RepID=I3T8N7_MEDTR|nr:unknown [Medicago truncatula]
MASQEVVFWVVVVGCMKQTFQVEREWPLVEGNRKYPKKEDYQEKKKG